MTKGIITNGADLRLTPKHDVALTCIEAGIRAAHPRNILRSNVSLKDDSLIIDDSEYDLSSYTNVYLVGGGNAAGQIAHELEKLLGEDITTGVIVTDDPVELNYIESLRERIPSRMMRESVAQVNSTTFLQMPVKGVLSL